MTVQSKQRVRVRMQRKERKCARSGRAAACLAAVAVPFWLMACGSSPEGGAGTESGTGREPSLPSTGNGSNAGSAPGAGAGAVEATPATTSEQPNPTPMLQAPMSPAGSASAGGEPATRRPPAAEQPPAQQPPAEQPAAQQPPAQQPPAEHTGLAANDVLLVGDSYFEIPNKELNRELSRLARAEGMIGDSESFRDNAISGTRLSGGFSPIPGQYASAEAQIPARVLVMDGGGNDIIQSNCASCAGVTEAIAAAAALFQQVAKDGTVEQIIFFYYPDFPNFPALRADAMDFMRPQLQSICQQSSVPCQFIDLRPLFVGHPEYTGPDNLHPSVAGSRVTAGAVFERLKASPVAQ
jgi:lysophospholipase L1-like esterase